MTSPFNVPLPGDDNIVSIRDFTIKRKRIPFRIDDDIFEAHAILGLPMMQNIVRISKNMSDIVDGNRFDAIFTMFDELLTPESAARFRERAMSVGDDAIDVKEQLLPIVNYLLEQYGIRPTQLSSDSSTGSPSETDGTTLTGGSAQAGSI